MTEIIQTPETHTATTPEAPRARASKPNATRTKKTQLIGLLRRKAGADVASLSATLGWQAHTTRAALSGLRKAGYELEAVKPGDGKPGRYRIIGSPDTSEAS